MGLQLDRAPPRDCECGIHSSPSLGPWKPWTRNYNRIATGPLQTPAAPKAFTFFAFAS